MKRQIGNKGRWRCVWHGIEPRILWLYGMCSNHSIHFRTHAIHKVILFVFQQSSSVKQKRCSLEAVMRPGHDGQRQAWMWDGLGHVHPWRSKLKWGDLLPRMIVVVMGDHVHVIGGELEVRVQCRAEHVWDKTVLRGRYFGGHWPVFAFRGDMGKCV